MRIAHSRYALSGVYYKKYFVGEVFFIYSELGQYERKLYGEAIKSKWAQKRPALWFPFS